MNKIFLYLLCINVITLGMEPPIATPPNRFFLRDLMKNYQERKPLDLASKSPQTLIEIENWIDYARNNENARADFAREFQSTPQEIGVVLEILDAEIQASQTPVVVHPQAPMLKPASRPLPIPPKVSAQSAASQATRRPLPPTPVLVPKPVPAPAQKQQSEVAQLIKQLEQFNAIKARHENVVQLKTVNQFDLGHSTGPATCPVQALRNVIHLLSFVQSGWRMFIDLLQDIPNAREFLARVEECKQGIQWLTAEEIKRIVPQVEERFAGSITALDTPQELSLHPALLKKLQEKFKQQKASHGFILGTMDVGQFSGERGHYFAFVIHKDGPDYLYLIADTAPGRTHVNPDSYDYKRLDYLADLITKGKSTINIEDELYKLSADRYGDMMARALIRGEGFNYKSLSKEELEGLEKTLPLIEKNKDEWKNRTRLDDKQLAYAVLIVKQKIQERLKQLQRK